MLETWEVVFLWKKLQEQLCASAVKKNKASGVDVLLKQSIGTQYSYCPKNT